MKRLITLAVVSGISAYIGHRIGYSSAKKKYEGLADLEVRSVKEKLIKYYEKGRPDKKKIQSEKPKSDISPKSSIESGSLGKVDPLNTDYGSQYRTESKVDRIVGHPSEEPVYMSKEEIDTTKPHIITPEEFNESNYEVQTLFYFADKTLTDDDYNIISNIGIVGGYKVLDQIGLYEADCLHVRDNKLATDYEILLDERPYSKIRPMGVIDEEE